MMGKKNNGKGIMIFVVGIILIAYLGYFSEALSTDKKNYVVGETVIIDMEYYAGSSLEIIRGEDAYRLFGSPDGEQKFIPSKPGDYNIIIYDASGNVVETASFSVYGTQDEIPKQGSISIKTGKNLYMLGESVLINYPYIIDKYELSISTPDNLFTYLGEPVPPINFFPEKPGLYEIRLLDKLTGEISTSGFIVNEEIQEGILLMNVSNPRFSQRSSFQPIIIENSKGRKTVPKANFLGDKLLSVPEIISTDSLSLGEIYSVELDNPSESISSIKIKNFVYERSVSLGIDELPPGKIEINGMKSLKSYAINMEFNFTNATATSIAKGTELYKCADWDFALAQCAGTWEKIADLTPGQEYSLELYPGDPGYAELGVASVNTNKSIYHVGETAGIIMVVLDTDGFLVRNANVTLKITTPDYEVTTFSTDSGTIQETSKGIYEAVYYNTGTQGNYNLFVSAKGTNVDNNMTSYFVVRDYYEFDILRSTPATIDPFKGPFKSSILIYSFTNSSVFDFTERLPSSFTVYEALGASIESTPDYTYLHWLGIHNGSTVSYTANSPLVTPELWEIGPSTVYYEGGIFTEARPWYLAVDPSYYYDPTTTILSGWTTGTGTTYAEIDDGIRQPSTPDTNNYVRQTANVNSPSQFGFPSVTEQEIDNLTLWVYTGTGSNAQYTFELRQGTTVRCSNSRPPNSATQWYSCTWAGVSGDLSDMSVYLSGVTRSGSGQNQPATVYAAYLEAIVGNARPNVTLNYPGNASLLQSSVVDFNFTAMDFEDSTLANCTLYANFSGTWGSVYTRTSVPNGSITNITRTLSDGNYLWNVECFDTGGKSAFAPYNYTVTVNADAPSITNEAINSTEINQSEQVRLNATITDSFGVSSAIATLRYPNGTLQNFTMSNSGSEYFVVFTNTNATGIYNITQIWANDSYNKATTKTVSLSFTVTLSPPGPFDLISPTNNTESSSLLPTFNWQQTQESTFANYTLILDKDINFGSADFVYTSTSITNTTITATFALDANSVYYWRVIAYDVFGSSTNSTNYFRYVTDTISPTVTLNSPSNPSFTAIQDVQFNFTPNDANTLDTCVLWSNFSGTFQANNTLTSVVKAQVNSINSSIPSEGVYVWNVRCNDSSGNAAFASQNFTITADYSGPYIQLIKPENNTYENITNIMLFEANATDLFSSTDICSLIINDVVEDTKSVSDGQIFNFTRFLINGYYNWSVNCTDTLGNEASSYIYNLTVEVIDNDPPLITLNYPSFGQYISTQDVTFNYTPEDATGIENCSLYMDGALEETNFDVDNFVPNYFIKLGLAQGNHNWTVQCVDNSTEFNSYTAPISTFYIDITNPEVILNYPLNDSFSTSSVLFNYTPSDDYLDECYLYGNFSGAWSLDQTNTTPLSGELNYFQKNLLDGTYSWNVICKDLAENEGFAGSNYTIKVDSLPPQYQDVVVSPSSPASYASGQSYGFNITWTDNFGVDIVLFENNFSGIRQNITLSGTGNVYNYTVFNLVPGNYHYRWFANDSINNKNQTSPFTYVVDKASSQIQVLLNGSNSNFSVAQGDSVNISGLLSVPSGQIIQVYLNGNLIANNTSPTENITLFETPGEYNVTAIYSGNQNYSYASNTRFVIVNDVISPVVSLISPENESLIGAGNTLFYYNVSDESSILNCSLYIDDGFMQADYNVTKNTSQFFSQSISQGVYTWRVDCYDLYNNLGQSGTYNFEAIDTDQIIVNVSPTKQSFERGENAVIRTYTTDVFGGALVTNITTDIIKGDTYLRWWNPSWNKRKPIFLNETTGNNITDQIAEVNITGLTNLTSCVNQLRIIRNESSYLEEVPFQLYRGDNSTWCYVAFPVNLSQNALNHNNYFVYYDNPSASNPGYSFSGDMSVSFFAQTAAADDGAPTNVANIVGFNDATAATIAVSGGGAQTVSAHGRDFMNMTPLSLIENVQVRYRYEVPTSTANWFLRYSVNDGGTYSNSFVGTTTQTKQTTSWLDITSAYASLTWAELNRTRLQGQVSKPGGGSAVTLNLFWVEVNVTGKMISNVTSSSVGIAEEFVARNSSQTNILGEWIWYWPTSGEDYGNYSAVSFASAPDDYQDAMGFEEFEIVPDSTPPNVTLVSPYDFEQRGVGMVNFEYVPYDINLANCTLYTSVGGFSPNATNTSPLNNQSNFFYNVYFGLGLHEWNVLCFDTEGNSGFAPDNFTLNITGPDLTAYTNDIYLGDEEKIEGNNVTIFVNVSNLGLTNASNAFNVSFYLRDPDVDGDFIQYVTVPFLDRESSTIINISSHVLIPGNNNIFVLIDSSNTINETDENNNKVNRTFIVELYQYYYGNVTSSIILADSALSFFMNFDNYTDNQGVVLFADADSIISFQDLRALTRTITGLPTADDFSNLDLLLNSSSYNDSIKTVWGGGTDTPLQTATFNLSTHSIENVPYVLSTNSSSFITGILWDSSHDTGNLQYDVLDAEDVVFVSKINKSSLGAYGTYDVEIRVPALLRDYKDGQSRIAFYVELI